MARKISSQFWTGATGVKLREAPRDARLLALYLITNPNANDIGLYELPLHLIELHAGIGSDEALELLGHLGSLEFCSYDFVHDAVWVHEMCRHQYGEPLKANSKFIKEVTDELRAHITMPFARKFWLRYSRSMHLPPWEELRPNDPNGAPVLPELVAGTKAEETKVLEVLTHYKQHHPRAMPNPQPSSKEFRLIRSRLKEGFSVVDLKRAIDGNHKSPFHCGENKDGTKYHSIDLIFRDATKVQYFIEMLDKAEAPAKQKVGL